MSERPAKPTADAAPAVPERVLLFCVASGTDYAGQLWLTKEGRTVVAALLSKGG
jgi:hypothetical protein